MKIIVILLAFFFCGTALATEPYSAKKIMLLQPDFVLRERIAAEDLSKYIKSAIATAETALSNVAKPAPSAGFIVVAVRPGAQSKVWLDFEPALPGAVTTQLRSSLEQIMPFNPNGGVVVFAINSSLWGAPATKRQGPLPKEWRRAFKAAGDSVEIGELVERIWLSKDGI